MITEEQMSSFVGNGFDMFSSLSGIADIYCHGVGGRTIAKSRKFDFHVVRQLVPDVIILELGSNDLVELSPGGVLPYITYTGMCRPTGP